MIDILTHKPKTVGSVNPRLKAGSTYPQLSAHRAKFHSTLVAECRRRLGEDWKVTAGRLVEHGEVLERRMGGHFACKRRGNAMITTHVNMICILVMKCG